MLYTLLLNNTSFLWTTGLAASISLSKFLHRPPWHRSLARSLFVASFTQRPSVLEDAFIEESVSYLSSWFSVRVCSLTLYSPLPESAYGEQDQCTCLRTSRTESFSWKADCQGTRVVSIFQKTLEWFLSPKWLALIDVCFRLVLLSLVFLHLLDCHQRSKLLSDFSFLFFFLGINLTYCLTWRQNIPLAVIGSLTSLVPPIRLQKPGITWLRDRLAKPSKRMGASSFSGIKNVPKIEIFPLDFSMHLSSKPTQLSSEIKRPDK